MANRSSIFSSEHALPGATCEPRSIQETVEPLHEVVRRRTKTSRFPTGAIVALGLVVAVHVAISTWVYPHPMPRRDLRRKVLALANDSMPAVLVFGDSRAECGFLPALLATHAGIAADRVVNLAAPACEPAGGLAVYREFHDRFAENPIVLLSVSLYGINDGSRGQHIGQESLWDLNLRERFHVASPQRALEATFLPERELLNRAVLSPLLLSWDLSAARKEGGYKGFDVATNLSHKDIEYKIEEFATQWVGDPVLDGVRWHLFQRNIDEMRAAGVQLVIVDPPEHPHFLEAIRHLPIGGLNARFHRQLASLCEKKGLPLLRYTAEDLYPQAPGSLFVNVLHLNRTGAMRMSERAGRDLRAMIEHGMLSLPSGK